MEGKRKFSLEDRELDSNDSNSVDGFSQSSTGSRSSTFITRKTYVPEFEESSTRDRSAFELSESGAIDLLVDTLQFHLDSLYSSTVSKAVKTRSLSKIVQTVAMIPAISLQASGLVGKLSMLLNLLRSESDSPTRFGLLNLAFILCVDDLGCFNVPIGLSSDMFEPVVRVIEPTSCASSSSSNSSGASVTHTPVKSLASDRTPVTSSSSQGENVNSTSKFHSKRVFKNKSSEQMAQQTSEITDAKEVINEPPGILSTQSVGFHSKRVFKGSGGGKPSCLQDKDSPAKKFDQHTAPCIPHSKISFDEFSKSVSFLSPQLCQTLVGRDHIDVSSTSLLALLLVNRIMTNLVQNSTRTSTFPAMYSRSEDETNSQESKVQAFQNVSMKTSCLSNLLAVLEASLSKAVSNAAWTSSYDTGALMARITKSADVYLRLTSPSMKRYSSFFSGIHVKFAFF